MSRKRLRPRPLPSDAVPALEVLLEALPDTSRRRLRFDEIDVDLGIAQMTYDARIQSGLTQAELAKRAGTTQSAISRIEDADYRGHSLKLLARIARALERRVEVRFVSDEESEAVNSERRRR